MWGSGNPSSTLQASERDRDRDERRGEARKKRQRKENGCSTFEAQARARSGGNLKRGHQVIDLSNKEVWMYSGMAGKRSAERIRKYFGKEYWALVVCFEGEKRIKNQMGCKEEHGFLRFEDNLFPLFCSLLLAIEVKRRCKTLKASRRASDTFFHVGTVDETVATKRSRPTQRWLVLYSKVLCFFSCEME